MTDAQAGQNEVDRMMRRVRAEVARQKALLAREEATATQSVAPAAAIPVGAATPIALSLPRFGDPAPIARKDSYVIDEFLAYHDELFVQNAYRGLLRREADPGGSAAFLAALRAGRLAKAEILGRVRYSAEGRAAGVKVRGLTLPFLLRTVRRAPVLGRLIGIVQYVARLPDIVRNHERLEATLFQREGETRRQINAAEALLEEAYLRMQQHADVAMRGHVAQLRAEMLPAERGAQLAARLDALDGALRSAANQQIAVEEIDGRLSAASERLRQLEERHRVELHGLSGRVEDGLRLVGDGLERLAATKVDLAQLQAMRDAAASEVDGIARAKVDRSELDGIIDGRLESFALRELKQVLDAFGEARADQARLARLADDIHAMRSDLVDTKALDGVRRELLDFRRNLLDTQHRLGALLERSRRRDVPAEPIDVPAESERMLDGFFASFENRFRGSPEEIRDRAAIYVPIVREARAGTAEAPVLDLGCGRGDWLELLREHGLIGIGVDVNGITVGACRERGLDVTQGDAVEYLRTLESGSIGAITALHVIEHLPFQQVVALLDEAFRVLRPNGVAVFETPNPENLLVGSCNFWFDPTHLRPLPPESTRFLVEARGFSPVEVLRLHPYPEKARLTEGPPSVQQQINQAFYGPQDYAIVARKD